MKWITFLLLILFSTTIFFAMGNDNGTYSFEQTKSPKDFFEKMFIEYATLSGGELDGYGDMTAFGVPHYQDKMKALSEEAHEKYYAMLNTALEKINTFDFEGYDTQIKYNLKTIQWFLENKVEGEKYRYHEAILAPLIGFEG